MVTHITGSEYAIKAKRLLEIARSLRDLGAEEFLHIPKISVIGGQSAGKSSLVEAVSGIRVPRDSGTCTRCPMEVNLSSSPGAWNCRISLRFEYNVTGQRLASPHRIPFGPDITDPDHVEIALRRAQVAVLNYPKDDSSIFLSKDAEELQHYRTAHAFASGTQKFSKNVVVVDICDENGTDLAFIDLPGLIQNEEPEIVKIVEELVKSNIQENCLILVTIPMSDDLENQRSMRLALEADDNKSRTIGVLTKPDTLTAGAVSARQKWRDLLTGQDNDTAHRLTHGYYCVKLLDDAERRTNPSRTERDEAESMFFSTTSPWDAVVNRGRFGVRNLVVDLGRHLIELLERTLPTLKKQAEEMLDRLRALSTLLPQPIQFDASTEVLARITDFSQEFTQVVYGIGTDIFTEKQDVSRDGPYGKVFVQTNRAIYDQFKREIRKTEPDFRPFDDHTQYLNPVELMREEDGSTSDQVVDPRDLTYVRQIIKGSISWELPNNVPFEAKRKLINDFTQLWDEPTINCFDQVAGTLQRALDFYINKHFGRFPKLRSHMAKLIMDLFSQQRDSALKVVHVVLNLEKYPLFTQNTHYLSSEREIWLAKYKDALAHSANFSKSSREISPCPSMSELRLEEEVPRLRAYPEVNSRPVTNLDLALYYLRAAGLHNLSKSDLTRLKQAPPVAYEEELIVMADVRAYYEVAYKRVIDYIPLAIEHTLNQAFAEKLKRGLIQELNLGSAEASAHLHGLLAEDPLIAQQRHELNSKIKSLKGCLDQLRSFEA